MLFDETERQRLWDIYTRLTDTEKAICRLTAVIDVPTALSNVVKCLNEARLTTSAGKRWTRPELLLLISAEPLCHLFQIVSSENSEHYSIHPLLSGKLWLEAERLEELYRFDKAVNAILSLTDSIVTRRFFITLAEARRALRVGLFLSEAPLFRFIMNKALTSQGSFFDCSDETLFLDSLANPLDRDTLLHTDPDVAVLLFPFLLTLTEKDADACRLVTEALFDYPHQGQNLLEMMQLDRLLLCGRLDDAEARLASCTDPQSFSIRAVLALLRQGDEEEALALYEEGLKRMRKAKDLQVYLSWTGIFYPILLFKTGRGGGKLKGYVKRMGGSWGIAENLISVLTPLKALLALSRDFEEEDPAAPEREHCAMVSFLQTLCLHWLGGQHGERARRDAPRLIQKFDALGMTLPSAELRDLLDGEGAAHPLNRILAPVEEWERSLAALSNITGGREPSPEKAATKRTIWEVGWRTGKNHAALSLALTPTEQTLQKSGWSKGRNISLQRLAKAAVGSLTDQDMRVASAVRASHGYYGTEYLLDIPKALLLLAGHPLVFNVSTGGRVEISARPPILSVTENRRGYVLQLSPYPEEEEHYAVREEGPSSLAVTRFEERHHQVARILGPSGLLIPKPAQPSLTKTLESLASILDIQSDIQGIGGAAEETEADSRLCVQIQPDGEGLDVQAVVRPLGAGGPVCRPGQGGANLLGAVGGRRVRTSRDLAAEAAALSDLQTACPVLTEGDQVGENSWRLEDPALALEFLAQLGEMKDAVVVEWPKGQTMRLASAPVGEGSFGVSVRSAKDWFSLSGELEVREDLVLSLKALLDAMQGGYGRFIPLGNGEFLALTREFQRRLKSLASLGEMKGEELRLSPLAAGVAKDLLDGAQEVNVAEGWRAQAALVAEAERMAPALPSTFRGELRDYQFEGFQWLMRLAHWGAGACLADDMGLGKTIQALALMVARGAQGPSLVVAPTSVCPNWADEAARFAPTLKVKGIRHGDRGELLSHLEPMDLVVTSYGLLQRERDLLAGVEWNVIVLDEAQAIKNTGTKRSLSAMKLRGAFRVATTGTPIENRLSELWNLFRFLNPGYLGSMDSFWRRFGGPIERDGDKEAKQRLKRMIRPFILRRTKDQVLSELPAKTEITLKVDLKDEERAFYEALRRSAIEGLEAAGADPDKGRFQVLAALMKLRRACCSASLAEEGIDLPSAKLEAFADVLTELREGGHKALVFSQFVDHLTILRRWLEGEGVPYQYLDGSTPQEERERRVAAFQSGEGDCFLISLRAGGTGLNLTAADYVIHMDPWWNPAVEAQASDRAHRIGQERPVTVYRIVARDTIEEQIVELHAWKRGLADGLLEEGGGSRLSVEELMDLIRGVPPEGL